MSPHKWCLTHSSRFSFLVLSVNSSLLLIISSVFTSLNKYTSNLKLLAPTFTVWSLKQLLVVLVISQGHSALIPSQPVLLLVILLTDIPDLLCSLPFLLFTFWSTVKGKNNYRVHGITALGLAVLNAREEVSALELPYFCLLFCIIHTCCKNSPFYSVQFNTLYLQVD